jgi:transglutaminase-like putative cysteine protease
MHGAARRIRVGFEMDYECPNPTPMILMVNIHPSRVADVVVPEVLTTTPTVPIASYYDGFGNRCCRIVAPAGEIRISADGVVMDRVTDEIAAWAPQHRVEDLPAEVLVYLMGSRYCETDRLTMAAWDLFGNSPTGWGRVQAICDYVHRHITFGYHFANPTKSAWEAFCQGQGVCRDYAHLAVTFCRCMNIPARYCTGYLGDMGTSPPYGPGDFAAWFEAYLGGRWFTFDPRNNVPRIGRILMARGRDATDVAMVSSFGPCTLAHFKVTTDEVTSDFPTGT